MTHATAGFIASVAEQAIGYMIDWGRHTLDYTNEYRAGGDPVPRMGKQLSGATLGILGYGAIGEHLARLGVAFGMKVKVSDPFKTIDGARRRTGVVRGRAGAIGFRRLPGHRQ